MKTKATIQTIGRSLSGNITVTLELPEVTPEEIKAFDGKALTVEIKNFKRNRSGEANAYFHVLVGKIAGALGESAAKIKNDMIAQYGQPEIIDDKLAYITTQIEPEKMRENEFLHTVLVDTRTKGFWPVQKVFYTYRVQRGSHTYDTAEMARLIDGTVQEAKDLGIETLTPDQIREMEAAWKGGGTQ